MSCLLNRRVLAWETLSFNGQWNAGSENEAAGYSGPVFGPTSLIINNECTGEDPIVPGNGGENRRIRAFKWLCNYFGVPVDRNESTLTCKIKFSIF
uniref:Uncharacterized protein n=1 Tax=Meloidogyne incognita TaxID=6306 RepID=A0A914L9S6_MELIC